ncbi:hypothetical protein Tco_0031612 [Tanacetum coccineum]
MRELREDTFSENKNEDAHDHVDRVLNILKDGWIDSLQELSTLGTSLKRHLSKGIVHHRQYCSPFKTARNLEEIHNFKQEIDETLYHAWERYSDLLYKCLQHVLNYQQKVHIFYTGLDISTRRMLDSRRMESPATEKKRTTTLITLMPFKKVSNRHILPRNVLLNKRIRQLSREQIGSPYRTRKTVCMIENPKEVHKLKAQEDEGDMDVVQPYMSLGPVHDKEKIIRKEEQDYDIPLHDGVMQPLTPQTVHITPPDDDYVAPATSPTLDNQLNKFRKECFDITRVPAARRQISRPSRPVKCKYETRNTGNGPKNEGNTDSYETLQHYGVTWTLDYAVTSFKLARWKVHVSSLWHKPLKGYAVTYLKSINRGLIQTIQHQPFHHSSKKRPRLLYLEKFNQKSKGDHT